MEKRFISHNLHWISKQEFTEKDPHLRILKNMPLVYNFNWWQNFSEPAIHILFGPRQIGKSTSLKQYIDFLLSKKNTNPDQIFYLACDSLADHIELASTIRAFSFNVASSPKTSYLFLDEVTFIKDWARAFKAIVDEGLLRNSVVVITGSDSIVLQDASVYFPGTSRRGKKESDINLHPLSFKEYLSLTRPELLKSRKNQSLYEEQLKALETYLMCGGFLSSINDYATSSSISSSTISTYLNWIIGDFIRKNKSRKNLTEVLAAIYPRIGSQVSYNKLAQECASISTPTLIDYIEQLRRLGVIRVLSAFNQNTLSGFPKKARKIHWCDPFLKRVVESLLTQEQLITKPNEQESQLVEGMVAESFARSYPTFYLKAEGEIDLVCLKKGKFYPIEVKWSNQVKPRDLKQLSKYPNSTVLYRENNFGTIEHIRVLPLLHCLLTDDPIEAIATSKDSFRF